MNWTLLLAFAALLVSVVVWWDVRRRARVSLKCAEWAEASAHSAELALKRATESHARVEEALLEIRDLRRT